MMSAPDDETLHGPFIPFAPREWDKRDHMVLNIKRLVNAKAGSRRWRRLLHWHKRNGYWWDRAYRLGPLVEMTNASYKEINKHDGVYTRRAMRGYQRRYRSTKGQGL